MLENVTETAEFESLVAELATMPGFLERTAAVVSEDRAAAPGPGGAFAFVEQVWHLADLEREGYGVRIERLLREEAPQLPDFDGGRIARERDYRTLLPAEGLSTFRKARLHNLEALRRASLEDRARAGMQEGVGRVTLGDIPRMMAEHDRSHRREIAELIAHLAGAVDRPA
jgi:DinB superfamily